MTLIERAHTWSLRMSRRPHTEGCRPPAAGREPTYAGLDSPTTHATVTMATRSCDQLNSTGLSGSVHIWTFEIQDCFNDTYF